MVEVMNRADAMAGGVGADAVLRVHHVVARRVKGIDQYLYGAQDAGTDCFASDVGKRCDPHFHPRVDGPEERAVPAAAQCPDSHPVARFG